MAGKCQYQPVNRGNKILETGQAMCGIPVLSLKRVNKPTTKDNWVVYRHRSDRGRVAERGACEMRQIVVLAGGRHGSFRGSEPEFWDVTQKQRGHCFG